MPDQRSALHATLTVGMEPGSLGAGAATGNQNEQLHNSEGSYDFGGMNEEEDEIHGNDVDDDNDASGDVIDLAGDEHHGRMSGSSAAASAGAGTSSAAVHVAAEASTGSGTRMQMDQSNVPADRTPMVQHRTRAAADAPAAMPVAVPPSASPSSDASASARLTPAQRDAGSDHSVLLPKPVPEAASAGKQKKKSKPDAPSVSSSSAAAGGSGAIGQSYAPPTGTKMDLQIGCHPRFEGILSAIKLKTIGARWNAAVDDITDLVEQVNLFAFGSDEHAGDDDNEVIFGTDDAINAIATGILDRVKDDHRAAARLKWLREQPSNEANHPLLHAVHWLRPAAVKLFYLLGFERDRKGSVASFAGDGFDKTGGHNKTPIRMAEALSIVKKKVANPLRSMLTPSAADSADSLHARNAAARDVINNSAALHSGPMFEDETTDADEISDDDEDMPDSDEQPASSPSHSSRLDRTADVAPQQVLPLPANGPSRASGAVDSGAASAAETFHTAGSAASSAAALANPAGGSVDLAAIRNRTDASSRDRGGSSAPVVDAAAIEIDAGDGHGWHHADGNDFVALASDTGARARSASSASSSSAASRLPAAAASVNANPSVSVAPAANHGPFDRRLDDRRGDELADALYRAIQLNYQGKSEDKLALNDDVGPIVRALKSFLTGQASDRAEGGGIIRGTNANVDTVVAEVLEVVGAAPAAAARLQWLIERPHDSESHPLLHAIHYLRPAAARLFLLLGCRLNKAGTIISYSGDNLSGKLVLNAVGVADTMHGVDNGDMNRPRAKIALSISKMLKDQALLLLNSEARKTVRARAASHSGPLFLRAGAAQAGGSRAAQRADDDDMFELEDAGDDYSMPARGVGHGNDSAAGGSLRRSGGSSAAGAGGGSRSSRHPGRAAVRRGVDVAGSTDDDDDGANGRAAELDDFSDEGMRVDQPSSHRNSGSRTTRRRSDRDSSPRDRHVQDAGRRRHGSDASLQRSSGAAGTSAGDDVVVVEADDRNSSEGDVDDATDDSSSDSDRSSSRRRSNKRKRRDRRADRRLDDLPEDQHPEYAFMYIENESSSSDDDDGSGSGSPSDDDSEDDAGVGTGRGDIDLGRMTGRSRPPSRAAFNSVFGFLQPRRVHRNRPSRKRASRDEGDDLFSDENGQQPAGSTGSGNGRGGGGGSSHGGSGGVGSGRMGAVGSAGGGSRQRERAVRDRGSGSAAAPSSHRRVGSSGCARPSAGSDSRRSHAAGTGGGRRRVTGITQRFDVVRDAIVARLMDSPPPLRSSKGFDESIGAVLGNLGGNRSSAANPAAGRGAAAGQSAASGAALDAAAVAAVPAAAPVQPSLSDLFSGGRARELVALMFSAGPMFDERGVRMSIPHAGASSQAAATGSHAAGAGAAGPAAAAPAWHGQVPATSAVDHHQQQPAPNRVNMSAHLDLHERAMPGGYSVAPTTMGSRLMMMPPRNATDNLQALNDHAPAGFQSVLPPGYLERCQRELQALQRRNQALSTMVYLLYPKDRRLRRRVAVGAALIDAAAQRWAGASSRAVQIQQRGQAQYDVQQEQEERKRARLAGDDAEQSDLNADERLDDDGPEHAAGVPAPMEVDDEDEEEELMRRELRRIASGSRSDEEGRHAASPTTATAAATGRQHESEELQVVADEGNVGGDDQVGGNQLVRDDASFDFGQCGQDHENDDENAEGDDDAASHADIDDVDDAATIPDTTISPSTLSITIASSSNANAVASLGPIDAVIAPQQSTAAGALAAPVSVASSRTETEMSDAAQATSDAKIVAVPDDAHPSDYPTVSSAIIDIDDDEPDAFCIGLADTMTVLSRLTSDTVDPQPPNGREVRTLEAACQLNVLRLVAKQASQEFEASEKSDAERESHVKWIIRAMQRVIDAVPTDKQSAIVSSSPHPSTATAGAAAEPFPANITGGNATVSELLGVAAHLKRVIEPDDAAGSATSVASAATTSALLPAWLLRSVANGSLEVADWSAARICWSSWKDTNVLDMPLEQTFAFDDILRLACAAIHALVAALVLLAEPGAPAGTGAGSNDCRFKFGSLVQHAVEQRSSSFVRGIWLKCGADVKSAVPAIVRSFAPADSAAQHMPPMLLPQHCYSNNGDVSHEAWHMLRPTPWLHARLGLHLLVHSVLSGPGSAAAPPGMLPLIDVAASDVTARALLLQASVASYCRHTSVARGGSSGSTSNANLEDATECLKLITAATTLDLATVLRIKNVALPVESTTAIASAHHPGALQPRNTNTPAPSRPNSKAPVSMTSLAYSTHRPSHFIGSTFVTASNPKVAAANATTPFPAPTPSSALAAAPHAASLPRISPHDAATDAALRWRCHGVGNAVLRSALQQSVAVAHLLACAAQLLIATSVEHILANLCTGTVALPCVRACSAGLKNAAVGGEAVLVQTADPLLQLTRGVHAGWELPTLGSHHNDSCITALSALLDVLCAQPLSYWHAQHNAAMALLASIRAGAPASVTPPSAPIIAPAPLAFPLHLVRDLLDEVLASALGGYSTEDVKTALFSSASHLSELVHPSYASPDRGNAPAASSPMPSLPSPSSSAPAPQPIWSPETPVASTAALARKCVRLLGLVYGMAMKCRYGAGGMTFAGALQRYCSVPQDNHQNAVQSKAVLIAVLSSLASDPHFAIPIVSTKTQVSSTLVLQGIGGCVPMMPVFSAVTAELSWKQLWFQLSRPLPSQLAQKATEARAVLHGLDSELAYSSSIVHAFSLLLGMEAAAQAVTGTTAHGFVIADLRRLLEACIKWLHCWAAALRPGSSTASGDVATLKSTMLDCVWGKFCSIAIARQAKRRERIANYMLTASDRLECLSEAIAAYKTETAKQSELPRHTPQQRQGLTVRRW